MTRKVRHFLSLQVLLAFLRGGWRIVGGRAGLRLIWENSQHPQMPCVISTRNGWILGQKEFRKVLPLSHNVQKQLDWDFMECANLSRDCWLFGANKRNNCQCSRTPKTSGDPRIWRFIGGLVFLSAVRPPAGSFGQKMPACSKKRPWHPPIFGGGRGKSGGFSPLTSRLLECGGRRLDGKRSDSWEKTVKSGGRRHFFTGQANTKAKAASPVRWINHLWIWLLFNPPNSIVIFSVQCVV